MKNLFNIVLIFLLSCSPNASKDANRLFGELSNDNNTEALYGSHGFFRGDAYHIFIDSLYIKFSNDKIIKSSRILSPTETSRVDKIGQLLEKNKISSFRGEIKSDEKFLEIKKSTLVLVKETKDAQYKWLTNKKIHCTRLNKEWFYYEIKAVDNS